jgi:hypothetical protein
MSKLSSFFTVKHFHLLLVLVIIELLIRGSFVWMIGV